MVCIPSTFGFSVFCTSFEGEKIVRGRAITSSSLISGGLGSPTFRSSTTGVMSTSPVASVMTLAQKREQEKDDNIVWIMYVYIYIRHIICRVDMQVDNKHYVDADECFVVTIWKSMITTKKLLLSRQSHHFSNSFRGRSEKHHKSYVNFWQTFQLSGLKIFEGVRSSNSFHLRLLATSPETWQEVLMLKNDSRQNNGWSIY